MTPEEAAEISPKVQTAIKRLTESMEKNPEHRAIVYSNFLDAGISPYEAALKKRNIPYGKFTGEVSKSERDRIVQDYNAGKLKALLLSSAGGEGLDLKGTRQIQILDPHWNKEKLEQVIARGIRYKSHADLPEDQRHVNVEQYVSVLPSPSTLGKLVGMKRPGGTDEYLRTLSDEKDRLNQQMRELLKNPPQKVAEADVFAAFADHILRRDRAEAEPSVLDLQHPERKQGLSRMAKADLPPRREYARPTTGRPGDIGSNIDTGPGGA
jgi:superfamily II DNA/RNA helicase